MLSCLCVEEFSKIADLPNYPVDSISYAKRLENFLNTKIKSGWLYHSLLEKRINKVKYFLIVFEKIKDKNIEIKVVWSKEAGIKNFPSSEKSFCQSVTEAFEKIEEDGWIFLSTLPKSIGTSNEIFLIFSRKLKPQKTESSQVSVTE